MAVLSRRFGPAIVASAFVVGAAGGWIGGATTARPTPSAQTEPPGALQFSSEASTTTLQSAPASTTSSTLPRFENDSASAPESVETGQVAVNRQIGMHIDDVPYQGLDLLDPIEEAIGSVDVVHWFQAWGGGHRYFRPDWFDVVSQSGKTGLVTWEPWALTGEASQPDYSPAAILEGRHDDYLRSWATGFAARDDGPWYLRPMHEMNGNWYPWSGGVPNGDPATYQAAWIHIHDLFERAGVSNVEWVWCPLVDDISGEFEDYYPGPEYVDVLCLDGYNWGTTDPNSGGWRPVNSVFDSAYERITALGDQPVWFAEVGSSPDGGNKAQWIEDLLSSPSYDRVEAIVFFGLNKERDWRVHADADVAQAVRSNR